MKLSDNKKPFFKKEKVRVILIILTMLLIIRLILPYFVLNYSNKKLAEMKGYYGHVDDVDLALFRGAYKLKKLYLNKIDTKTQKQVKFFDSDIIDLSIEWSSIFHGKLVGELEFESPVLRFTKEKAEPSQVQKDTADFRKLLKNFMPLKINRFEVNHGIVHYIDSASQPIVNLKMVEVYILAKNLKNIQDTSLLPAPVYATAEIYGGNFELNLKMNPLAKNATFDLDAKLENTNLVELNDFFLAYGKFDVNKGKFGLYAEMAAKDGNFIGYVKPVIKDLEVLGPEDRNKDIIHQLWEGIVGASGEIFRNQKHQQVATKIPIRGTFKNKNYEIWYAVIVVLQNAFIQALQPSIDYEINIQSIDNPPKDEEKGFIKKIFGKGKFK